jgi:hypothetical protein
MNKLVIAAATVAALTSASILPAVAQNCLRLCEEKTEPERCGDQLGHMKRVYPAEVLGVDDHHRVWVTEFCPASDLMRSDGNAAYLRTAIARNDVLVDILGDKGYHADDVFAVKMMGDETISLYVHRFDD